MVHLIYIILKELQQNYFVLGFLLLLSFFKSFKGRPQQLNTQTQAPSLCGTISGNYHINKPQSSCTNFNYSGSLWKDEKKMPALNCETGKTFLMYPGSSCQLGQIGAQWGMKCFQVEQVMQSRMSRGSNCSACACLPQCDRTSSALPALLCLCAS